MKQLAESGIQATHTSSKELPNYNDSPYQRALPSTGFLRISDIIGDARNAGLLPISRSHWYGLIAKGSAPEPIKMGRASLWRVEDVLAFIDLCSKGDLAQSGGIQG